MWVLELDKIEFGYLILPVSIWVTLSTLLNLSETHFLFCKMGTIIASYVYRIVLEI